MNIVILSGGSGKRLWPLSNDTQSKQFLRLLKNEQGEYESMVERVMRQIRKAQPDAKILVSCYTLQEEVLGRQLGTVDVISEPERRDTFPAIALAASYLHYKKQLDENESFVVCPIDPFADETFFELFSNAEELVKSKQKQIGLVGAIPTYPSGKYGYILQNGGAVTGFVEKPSEKESECLIADGALWNCGVFALKIGYVLEHARKYAGFDSFESLHNQYGKLPKISFDYEVTEKEHSIGVVVYDGTWKDLGTWNTLTEEMSGSTVGDDVYMSDDCKNTHVLNMLNIPVIAQDMSNTVVVASYDGILVSSKPGSSHIKPLADQINIRPMYEQRQWGNYRVLDSKKTDETSSLVKRIRIDAGHTADWQGSQKQNVTLVVVSGRGMLEDDGENRKISQGSTIKIPQDKSCSILAETDLELIGVEVQPGDGGHK